MNSDPGYESGDWKAIVAFLVFLLIAALLRLFV
jgi:hypothetical protein